MDLSNGVLEPPPDLTVFVDFEAEIKLQLQLELEHQQELEADPKLSKIYTQIKENFKTDVQELSKYMGLLALECLFVMSFNKKASEILKKDEYFMSQIRKFANDNNLIKTNERLKKTIDGLLWKVENEEEFKKQQETSMIKQNNEFDLMISYSWHDKPLVRQIYKYLTEQFNYRIWLDENQMSGSLCQAMAQAVEKSKFVLMCMSETYKTSENCRNEAEYARDRKKTIIPLIVRNVERDGWLGFISAGKMYIDFMNQDFDKAINLLQAEIERHEHNKEENIQQHKPKEINSSVAVPIPKAITASVPIATKLPVRPTVISNDYKKIPLESWSEQHVQDFLYDNKLDMMILLTENMNGEQLYLLFEKCQREHDCWATFDRLNGELKERHQETLQISLYLRFVNLTQKYTNVLSF
ncbi:unnamed protein product [Rotaria sordida]|uniref:TIR domain-containing protein n=2 Tax=Rotaria sordida TaxID=392033 RepID=A0A819JS62_9BILA|nr:unnamed protein product [Rotaria sordida]CAF3937564.1 unnamed protein product [Rotaria sordida]